MREHRAVSDELIVAQCSPTLAGLKTGSLFSCPMEQKEELFSSLRRLNAILVPRGLRILPVKRLKGRILLYLYRPDRLRADLRDGTARDILWEKAYPVENVGRCVAELVRRLQTQEAFPHEVGLFLGYPAADVDGFMRLGADRAKCVGIWCVYGDEDAAKKTFSAYRKCKKVYADVYRRNRSFDQLVVSRSYN